MTYCKNGDVRVHYVVAGEGPPLVLLHAIPFDHTLWMYQIAHFSTRFKTIAIDLRAWGRTDAVRKPYAMDDLVGDVLAVCKAEDVTKCVLTGISVGSRVAMQCVLDHPSLFNAVVLVGSGSRPSANVENRIADYAKLDGKPDALTAYRRDHAIFGVSKGYAQTPLGKYLLESFVERTPWTSGRAIASLFEAFGRIDHLDRVKEITMPTLVMNGEFDGALPSGKWTAEHIKGALHRVIPNTGHACNLEDPARFDAVMAEFLAANGLWPEVRGG
jgi:3-oxoadipate enol-lactonase